MTEALEIQSFKEVYKTYSHGLEAIYALENVDIASIRPMASPSKAIEENKSVFKILSLHPQYEMDFGHPFRKWITPFVLNEPFTVLSLSRQAEKALTDQGKRLLGEIIDQKLHGIGQGHIEEIQHKLNRYIAGRDIRQSYVLDMRSWFVSALAKIPKKKIFVAAEKYGLQDWFPLAISDQAAVKRMSLEDKEIAKREVFEELAADRESALISLQQVAAAFIAQWMFHRLGIAAEHEILERLERICTEPQSLKSGWSFLKDAFFRGKPPLSFCLNQLGENIYCVDAWHTQAYQRIESIALTYFYKPEIYYSLEQLVQWISRECSKYWEGFPEGFVEKVLRYSPKFNVRKESTGRIIRKLTKQSSIVCSN
jgi:hypothetical protein